jgi:flagellar biogenesis protein FliO
MSRRTKILLTVLAIVIVVVWLVVWLGSQGSVF